MWIMVLYFMSLVMLLLWIFNHAIICSVRKSLHVKVRILGTFSSGNINKENGFVYTLRMYFADIIIIFFLLTAEWTCYFWSIQRVILHSKNCIIIFKVCERNNKRNYFINLIVDNLIYSFTTTPLNYERNNIKKLIWTLKVWYIYFNRLN